MGMCRYCENKKSFSICNGDCIRCGIAKESNTSDAEREVVVGGVYRHFKGSLYIVRGIGTHTETGEELVIYTNLPYETCTWVRPYQMFVSEVDRDKYPNATQKYRFQLLKG